MHGAKSIAILTTENPMKICILLSDITKVGGIERVTSTLVGEFNRETDIQIEILSIFKGRAQPAYQIPNNIKIHYLSEESHGAKPHSWKRAIKMFSLIFKLRKFLRSHWYDIIMVQSFPPTLLAFMANINQKRTIAVEHVYAGYYGKVTNVVRDYVYSRLAKIIVLTSNDLKFFEERGLGTKTMVIPNPVLPSDKPKSECNAKRIISVGRLVSQKGYDNLIAIFKEVNRKHPDWILDIYGDGPLKEQLQQQINDADLHPSITLKGLSNHIPDELAKSSIFVLSSHFEGFPMVLIESMNQGVPCVSYDCPNGPGDIVKTGENGILVPNQDKEAMVKALNRLIENSNERKNYGHKAPNSVKHFAKELIAQKWIELFKQIYSSNG